MVYTIYTVSLLERFERGTIYSCASLQSLSSWAEQNCCNWEESNVDVVYISYLYAIPCPSLKCLKEELYTPVLHYFQSNPYPLVLNTTAILENRGPLTESRIMPKAIILL